MADDKVLKPARVSWEQRAIQELRHEIGDRLRVEPVSGMGSLNRRAPDSWELKVMQQFQFGDLRYETTGRRVVVEVERGCKWEQDWHARMFTYGHKSASGGMAEAASYVIERLA